MKNLVCSAVVTLFAASTVQAQQAVQWKVSDGGNGHWYGVGPSMLPWLSARSAAAGFGGQLATLPSVAERQFVAALCASSSVDWAWIGGFQPQDSPGYQEPAGGWTWIDGTPIQDFRWSQGEPNNDNQQDYLRMSAGGLGDDLQGSTQQRFIIEWSADCNGDGIVDYGQCRDGSLPDYNGNNIPDCCEAGTPCVVGNYPVQWRAVDGGNGHWYEIRYSSAALSWTAASARGREAGGHLATITSAAEQDYLRNLVQSRTFGQFGPWLGGYQDSAAPDYSEPAGGWRWVTGEPWTWVFWESSDEPNNAFCTPTDENRLHYIGCSGRPMHWNDLPDSGITACCGATSGVSSFIVEWSADCNNDGIVDKGQILQGQLPDINDNGIPDPCEQPTCRNADLLADRNVNGVDLGILLGQWGPNTQYTISDINSDGVVDGSDLGLLLSFWGPCPY